MFFQEFNIPAFEYAKPEPSLCDSCIFASNLAGGSVSIGYNTYQQRYCPKPPVGREGTLEGRAIHASGYRECSYYQPKANPSQEKQCSQKF